LEEKDFFQRAGFARAATLFPAALSAVSGNNAALKLRTQHAFQSKHLCVESPKQSPKIQC
jgi:hypothetical protein